MTLVQAESALASIALPPAGPPGRPLSIVTRKANIGSYALVQESPSVGKKLYVGNLSYTMSSSDLEQLFGQYGTVASAQVIQDRETGRSKGFGFVEMSS